MINSIEIKRATPEDAQLLSDLSNVTFIETYLGICPDEEFLAFMDENFNEEVIRRELENSDDFYFIAFADGFPAGYMRMTEDDENYPLAEKYKAIHLKRIYVLKEYHSKKIGAALMNHAFQFTAKKGYDMLWLGVWEENKKAIEFYKKFEFEDRNLPHDFYIGKSRYTDYWLLKFLTSQECAAHTSL